MFKTTKVESIASASTVVEDASRRDIGRVVMRVAIYAVVHESSRIIRRVERRDLGFDSVRKLLIEHSSSASHTFKLHSAADPHSYGGSKLPGSCSNGVGLGGGYETMEPNAELTWALSPGIEDISVPLLGAMRPDSIHGS